MTISELCEKIECKLKGKNPRLYKIDMLVPAEELKQYRDMQILICAVEKNLLIPMCCTCASARPNGKWIPSSEYTMLLKKNYRPISFSYCPECLKKEANNFGFDAAEINPKDCT